jgi:hypothetical protein
MIAKQMVGVFAVLAALILSVSPALASGPANGAFAMGQNDLRNSTIIWDGNQITVLSNTMTGNNINFTGFGGSQFWWAHDNAVKMNVSIPPATALIFAPGQPVGVYDVIYYNDTLILRTNLMMNSGPNMLAPASIGNFFYVAMGDASFIFLLIIPVAAWLRTGSIAVFCITMLELGSTASAVALPDVWKPFALLPAFAGVGVMLFRLYYKQRDEE